ncbi:MAG: DUF2007 domain-containing protein [Sedimentibacter sp.]|uniref:putative signal transducing protein n=1 Tax=Sedimentibacter sp. TaxID=1960295 RepID=UPI00315949E4
MADEFIDGDDEALLLFNLNKVEAEIIMSKLRSYGIPVLKKEKGTGEIMEIYTGTNLYGIDLYVPAHVLDVARELLESSHMSDQIDDEI